MLTSLVFCALAAPLPSAPLRNDGSVVHFADLKTALTLKQIQELAQKSPQKIQSVLRREASLPVLQRWRQDNRRWVRGEIEDEKVLETLLVLTQLELLAIRLEKPTLQKQTWDEMFNFAADLAYAESTPVGLKLAHTIRSLLFDEMERFEKKNAKLVSQEDWIQWVRQVRTPWPVDRMILFEGQRLARAMGLSRKQLEGILRQIQKNVHQPLQKVMGGMENPLHSVWTDKDIALMHDELVRRASFQIRWAEISFQKKFGRRPSDAQDLVKEGILAELPLNYRTGKPLSLSEAQI